MESFQSILELLRKETIENLKIFLFEDNLAEKINLDTFSYRLTTGLGFDLEEKSTKRLFYQLDLYCKECINFRRLEKYIEAYEKLLCKKKDDNLFHTTPSIHSGVKSLDSIFEWTIYTGVEDSGEENSRHYLSLSRNGLLTFWSHNIKKRFEKQISVLEDGANMSTMATGLACIPNYKLIAVSTTSGDIRFFNSNFFKFRHKFSITWLPSTVMCLSCHDSQKLICGDFAGTVYVINMEEIFFQKLFRRAFHLEPPKILFNSLRKGEVIGLNFQCTEKAHYTPVVKVKYVSCIRAITSCSVSTKRAMLIHFMDGNGSLNFSSEGGITCFDFCEKLNCVVTGGKDHTIKLWNPMRNVSCNETLMGHFSSITHVIVDNDRLFIISADREKTIRIWDMLRSTCLQIIKFKASDFPNSQKFAFLFLDSEVGKLIITTYRVAVLEIIKSVHRPSAHPGCKHILLVEYSNAFDCLISVGDDSTVAVWDAESKNLIYEFHDIHFTTDKLGFSKIANVTVAGLDPSGRRLITAGYTDIKVSRQVLRKAILPSKLHYYSLSDVGKDGSVKIWNVFLGICLKTFKANLSVLALSFVGYEIFAGGSSGKIISFYDDGESEVDELKFKVANDQPVTSMSCYGDNIIATSSSDGEIIIWFWKTADVKLRMKDNNAEMMPGDSHSTESVTNHENCRINQILFLHTRKMEPIVANLVSCGNDGRIRFWNIICTSKENQSQLVSRFRSVFNQYDSILCMATNDINTILLSGDTLGYVRTYNLEDYYASFQSLPSNAHETKHFEVCYPFLRMQRLIDSNPALKSKFELEGGAEYGHAPLLLNCYHAHIGPIQKISYSNQRAIVITAGNKSSIRLWALSGIFVSELAIGSELLRPFSGRYLLPKDIKPVASALTLQVLNHGQKPHWEQALKAIRRCRLSEISGKSESMILEWMVKRDKKQVHSQQQNFNLHYELRERLLGNKRII